MIRIPYLLFLFYSIIPSSVSQEALHSAACKSALELCENDLECSNRLSHLMSACTTGTCQPQCRKAVLNVYQNKLGRVLLRSDASCIPGREELKTCNFLPNATIVHCSLSKLACEADLQCNSKWGTFNSECESETQRGECSTKCKDLLNAVTSTPFGSSFKQCSCTDREDQQCQALRDNLLGSCNKPTPPPVAPGDNSVTSAPDDATIDGVSSSRILFPTLLLCTLFVMRLYLTL